MEHDAESLFEGLRFTKIRHGNKGYPRDPITGQVRDEEKHLGYAWHYRCVEIPRLVMVHHIMNPVLADWTEWWVDGEKCIDAAQACNRLNVPAELTLPEYLVLERIGQFPCGRTWAINTAAGAENPNETFIDGRWAQVSRAIDSLVDKGILKWREGLLCIK
jgi:hypothetical protein